MTHPRKLVREAFASVLAPIAATVQTRRGRPLADADLPAIRVTTPEDSAADPETIHEFVMPTVRAIAIACEVVAKALDDVESVVDGLCEQIEEAIEDAPTLGGTVLDVEYRGFSSEDDIESDQPVLVGRMTFEARIART